MVVWLRVQNLLGHFLAIYSEQLGTRLHPPIGAVEGRTVTDQVL